MTTKYVKRITVLQTKIWTKKIPLPVQKDEIRMDVR